MLSTFYGFALGAAVHAVTHRTPDRGPAPAAGAAPGGEVPHETA
ncbi:hypothetical protein ACIQM0_24960 [Streptomyces sp. NPDC091387]